MSYGHKLYDYKDDFDFFDDPLPENNLLFAFGDQLSRARGLLKVRSRDQVNYLIESLDWMLKKGDEALFKKTMKEAETEGQAFINRVKALKSYAALFDITNQESLLDATWTDYFATLSLVTILEALHPDNCSEPFTDYAYPMEAMEAVCIAEFYKELAENNINVLRKRGHAGGKKAARDFNMLTNKVLKYYRDTPGINELSNRRAAYLIYEGPLREEIDATLNTEEPDHRIAIWIGKYLNKKLKIT